ncbi:MAG: GntR family transcriptional regulator [Rhodospirillaceae bacterium]|nr:GntR family transcriptional regulator [Rhodospirillales bacterium]
MLKQTDIALRQLKADLLKGVFLAGTRLGEGALAQRYNMSRTPIREALSILAGQGWVIRTPGERRWIVGDLRMHIDPHPQGGMACPACGSPDYRLLTDVIGQVLWCQACFRVSHITSGTKNRQQLPE